MIDSAVRILSLANQLDFCTGRVRLDFIEGEPGALGYLNRMGFFDHLSGNVEVTPSRPMYSGARLYRGGNSGLVEIARINKNDRDRGLPDRLTEAVERSCRSRRDVTELSGAAWTIFAELIDNVFSHSQTPLGWVRRAAGLQRRKSAPGRGIRQRPRHHGDFATGVADRVPRLVGLSDTALLVEVFRQGLSRHGNDRGCGLKGSAAKAIKFQADLDVRLPGQRVLLTPARGAYQANTAHCFDDLPLRLGYPHRLRLHALQGLTPLAASG